MSKYNKYGVKRREKPYVAFVEEVIEDDDGWWVKYYKSKYSSESITEYVLKDK